jgi:hypothetical protein
LVGTPSHADLEASGPATRLINARRVFFIFGFSSFRVTQRAVGRHEVASFGKIEGAAQIAQYWSTGIVLERSWCRGTLLCKIIATADQWRSCPKKGRFSCSALPPLGRNSLP